MILCIDIGGTRIKYAKIDNVYKMSDLGIIPTPNNLNDFKRTILEIVANNQERHIGICVAGIVDYHSKTIKHSPNMQFLNGFSFNELPINAHIEIENDANAACLNSYRIHKIQNMIHLTLGTGLGGGAIVNGQLLKSSISVFEVGHISVNVNGKRCGCNNRGCIEQYTGASSLIKFANQNGIFDLLENIFSNYTKNNASKRIVNRFAQYLGIVVADLINIFGSDLVVFSGGMALEFDVWRHILIQTVQRRSFVYRIKPCKFAVDKDPEFSGLFGIASKFIEESNG